MRKMRVMVVREETLERFGDPEFRAELRVLLPHHRDRIRTLAAVQRRREEERDGGVEVPLVERVTVYRRAGER